MKELARYEKRFFFIKPLILEFILPSYYNYAVSLKREGRLEKSSSDVRCEVPIRRGILACWSEARGVSPSFSSNSHSFQSFCCSNARVRTLNQPTPKYRLSFRLRKKMIGKCWALMKTDNLNFLEASGHYISQRNFLGGT